MKLTIISKFRNTLVVTLIASSLLAISGCAPGDSENNQVSASTSSTGSSTKEGDEPVETHGLDIKGMAANENGQYQQITLSKNDPSLEYKPELVNPSSAKKFSAEQIKSAQKFAMTFIAEEMFDSTLNGGTQIDGWFANNSQKIAPEFREELRRTAQAGKDFVNRKSWGSVQADRYAYAYNKNSTRILDYEIKLVDVLDAPEAPESIGFKVAYDYTIAAKDLTTGQTLPIHVKGTGHLYVRAEDGNPKNWLITAIRTDYEGFMESANAK